MRIAKLSAYFLLALALPFYLFMRAEGRQGDEGKSTTITIETPKELVSYLENHDNPKYDKILDELEDIKRLLERPPGPGTWQKAEIDAMHQLLESNNSLLEELKALKGTIERPGIPTNTGDIKIDFEPIQFNFDTLNVNFDPLGINYNSSNSGYDLGINSKDTINTPNASILYDYISVELIKSNRRSIKKYYKPGKTQRRRDRKNRTYSDTVALLVVTNSLSSTYYLNPEFYWIDSNKASLADMLNPFNGWTFLPGETVVFEIKRFETYGGDNTEQFYLPFKKDFDTNDISNDDPSEIWISVVKNL